MSESTSIVMVPNMPSQYARRAYSTHRVPPVVGEPTINFWYPQGHCLLQFSYVNWHGCRHDYTVDPESVEFGPYEDGPLSEWRWVLHANVVTRDGDVRPEMGPTRRRTFLIEEIENLRSVRRSM